MNDWKKLNVQTWKVGTPEKPRIAVRIQYHGIWVHMLHITVPVGAPKKGIKKTLRVLASKASKIVAAYTRALNPEKPKKVKW